MSQRQYKSPPLVNLSRHSVADLVRRLVAAERALTWYANPNNWREDDWQVLGVVQPPEYGNPGK